MIAVSDSSPLILFAGIDRLDLIERRFGEVLVPPAVWHEVVSEGAGRAGADQLARTAWIAQRPLPPVPAPTAVAVLHPGEAEAIHLAVSLRTLDPIVLLDDRRARAVAGRLGLAITGSAGLLVQAKAAGFVDAVGPLLDRLRATGLYLGDAAARDILRAAREA